MPDYVTAISFDTAVMTFGIWIENGLREGRSLEELLDIEASAPSLAENERQFAALRALTGGGI